MQSSPASVVPTSAYQAPFRPASHPNQCYYRAQHGNCMPRSRLPIAANIQLFRFDASPRATLELSTNNGRIFTPLDVATLLTLRNAIDDALHDIAQLTPEMPQGDESAAERSSAYAGESFA